MLCWYCGSVTKPLSVADKNLLFLRWIIMKSSSICHFPVKSPHTCRAFSHGFSSFCTEPLHNSGDFIKLKNSWHEKADRSGSLISIREVSGWSIRRGESIHALHTELQHLSCWFWEKGRHMSESSMTTQEELL